MASSVKVTGLRELNDVLSKLAPNVQKRVAGNAIRAGARLVATDAKRRVPVDTGQLKRSIVVRAAKGVRTGVGAVVAILRPRSRIAHLIEFGTSKTAAQPFLRPALDSQAQPAIRKVGEILRKGVEREAAKQRRR